MLVQQVGGGKVNSHNAELYECLSSTNLIGVRSACASRRSLAVDCSAPVL